MKPFPFAIRLVAADSGGKGGGRGDVLLVAESDDDMQRWLALLSAELRVYERAAFAARYVARERDGWSVERPAWRAGWRAPPRKAMFELSVATHGNGGAGEGAAPDQKPNAQKAALQRMVLSLLRAPRRCRAPLATSEGARTALAGALAGLRHPYLLPAAHGGYDRERRRVVVVRPFCREGSLRDRLHRAARGEPLNSNYVDKYLGGVLCARAPVAAPRGLGVAEVASIGRQVLEALQYLQDRKLRGAHLHAGNVVLDRGRAMLTDVIENELLGLPVRGAGPEQGAAAGVAAFGRLLHEMATGRALEGSAPTLVSPAGMAAAKAVPPPVMTVLRLIFEAEERPPLAEVLKAPLFANQVLLADGACVRALWAAVGRSWVARSALLLTPPHPFFQCASLTRHRSMASRGS